MDFRHLPLLLLFPSMTIAAPAPVPEPPMLQSGIPANAALNELKSRMPDNFGSMQGFIGYSRQVAALVERNVLETGEDFREAARLMSMLEYDFRTERVRYELVLAAIAKDDPEAPAMLPVAWNSLLGTLGRPLRLDFVDLTALNPDAADYAREPAPASVQAVYKDPAGARAAAEKSADNGELQQLADADQAPRKVSTAAETTATLAADRQRAARTAEIATAGGLHTAKDFANAARVLLRAADFARCELAHELAVDALLLGDRGAGRALVATTYDRMLTATGHDQRFATQYGLEGLLRVDESGICDGERQALGCPTLAEARRKK